MKSLSIAIFEFRYLFRSLQTLVIFGIFFGMTFIASLSGEALFGTDIGNINVNSPFLIMKTLIILSIFSIFISPSFVADSVIRDTDCHYDGILFSTPIDKKDYLFGRFLGSTSAMCVAFSGAPLGMFLGSFLSTAEPELIGPINISHYLTVYFVFIVPSLLSFGALIFAVALLSKRIIYTYITAFSLWTIYLIVSEFDLTPSLIDPFMYQVFEEKTKFLTAVERNTQLISIDSMVLINRTLWLGLSAIILAFSYWKFSLRAPAKHTKNRPVSNASQKEKLTAEKSIGFRGTPQWNKNTEYRQLTARTKFEVLSVITSLPFIIVLSLSALLLFFKLLDNDIMYQGVAYPLTRLMIDDLSDVLLMTLIGILIFYSADIVWRERYVKFDHIIDSLPTPNWVFVISKISALILIMISILTLGIVLAISIQLAKGFSNIEVALYLERGLFYAIIPFVCLAILASFLQVIAKSRFIGMIFFALYIAYVAATMKFGFEHPLLHYGLGGFLAPLSDMNGSGRFIIAGYWIRIYWLSIAGLLIIMSYLMWQRGTLQPFTLRLRALSQLKSNGLAITTAVLISVFFGSGGYIFYNTNILNQYLTIKDIEIIQLNYEKHYRQYEHLPMPHIVDVKMDLDIYPKERRIEARSTQILRNETDQTIQTIHVIFPMDIQVSSINIEGGRLSSVDPHIGYHIFELNTFMQPNETRQLTFESVLQQQGFTHANPDTNLVRNGTYIGNQQFAPKIGFDRGMMISDRNTRREYGLAPLARMPKLENSASHDRNYVSYDSDFIAFETTVSTIEGQTAVAPGYLINDWVKNGRHYFHYKMDAPIMNFYGYLSAEYQVVKDKWRDVNIEIFYHGNHTYNIERMMAGAKDSLTYFTQAFGPYQYRQLRILEVPNYRISARAYPSFIPFSEGIGFVADVRNPSHIDLPYYVTAHEVAHQWWAHQVMAAEAQGGTMLIESLAQYSALLVMEQKYGKHQLRKFLKFELDKYLSSRANDPEGELPLYRVEGQAYIHYRKGAVVMYALRDYIGEEAVNRALRKLIKNHAYRSKPYAISSDLLGYLKESAVPMYHGLISDLFEKITFYDVKLIRSQVTELPDGRFQVELELDAEKYYEDEVGNKTKASFDLDVDIGLFSKSPDDKTYQDDNVIMLEKRKLAQGKSIIELIVNSKPEFAGIDPYHKLIDRNTEDNLAKVTPIERR